MITGQIYSVAAAQVMTELGPGASRMITWNQEDDNGNSVPTGDYAATVQATLSSSSSQSTSSQVSFEITE
jgi:flagellar hook assembly protein FlgD